LAYEWWKLIHVAGAFGFLIAHGVSIGVSFRVRKERDPVRVLALLQLSGSSILALYVSLVVLVGAGVVMGFLRHWWSYIWIWAAIGVLAATILAMYAIATPYYRKVRLVAGAMAEGSTAVSQQDWAALLTSPRMFVVTAVGLGGLGVILWLMVMQPHPFGTF
jgi:hypothetical protein